MNTKSYHKLIEFLIVCLFSSFYLFNTSKASTYSLIIISLIMLIVRAVFAGSKIEVKLDSYFTTMLAFSAFSILSSLWAWNASYAFEKGITIFEILVCMLIIRTCIDINGVEKVQLLIDAVIWSGYLVAIYILSIYGIAGIRSVANGGIRLSVEFAGLNATAILMAVTIVLSIQNAFESGWKWKYLLTILPVILLAIFESRTAILETAAGILIVLYFRVKSARGIKKAIRLILGITATCAIVVAFMNLEIFSEASKRFFQGISLFTGGAKYDHSALLRQQMAKAGWEQFIKTPLVGIGMGNGRLVGRTVTGWDCYLHNNYSEMLVDGGIIGTLIFYSFHLRILSSTFKAIRYRNIAHGTLCVFLLIILLLVGDIGTVTYYSKDTYFYLLIGFEQLLEIRNKEMNSQCEQI